MDKSEDEEKLKNQVSELCKEIETKAKNIIHYKMPQKILLLEDMYKNMPEFNQSLENFRKDILLDTGNIEPIGKKRKFVDETTATTTETTTWTGIPSNKTVTKILAILKSELYELIDMLNTVKIWIQLNIPTIEDGNNFGVSVQEDTVGELGRAESDAFSVLEATTRYYVSRGKLVSKMLKYPMIHDYRVSVIEFDEKEYLRLRLCILDLRNNCAGIYDLINKNHEKIEKPRSSHNQLLY